MSIPRDRRTSRLRPCPVCGGTSWCIFLPDATAVWCGRIASWNGSAGFPRRGGWVHRLTGGDAAPAPRAPRPPGPDVPRPDFPRLARAWHRAMTPDRYGSLSRELGVSAASLSQLGVGWATAEQLAAVNTPCHADGCWTFPMTCWPVTRHDSHRHPGTGPAVGGIRVRTRTGRKYAVTGSAGDGLFVPTAGVMSPAHRGQLLLPEGPTSAAALITLGYVAVGRPNNIAGVEHLRRLLASLRPTRVVVMGDNDPKPARYASDGTETHPARWPGRDGAEAIAEALTTCFPRVDVSVCLPPVEFKDVREWARGGATRLNIWRQLERARAAAVSLGGQVA